jgi:hypothetical protein
MRLHRLAFLGVLVFASAAPLVAFCQFQAPSSDELKMTSDPKAPGADAVYLYREETEDDPHHFRTVYARIKVLTEAGKELATVRIGYERNFQINVNSSSRQNNDPSRSAEDARLDPDVYSGHYEVAALSGRTIHPDGTVIPLAATPADLMQAKQGATQVNAMTFNLPSVEVGSILEYRYQLRYDRFQSAPFWQIQQPYYVHKAHYSFIPDNQFVPNGVTGAGVGGAYLMNSHGQTLTDLLATSTLPPGRSLKPDALGHWGMDLTDVPPIPREMYAPPLQDQVFKIHFYYSPSFAAKEYWQNVMQLWNKEVHQFTTSSGAIKQAADEAVAPADSPLDRAKKLYALAQKLENTDYSGTSGVRFFSGSMPSGSVDTVLQNKSGNSNQIALLYLALARAEGLNARPERIASRNHRMFSTDYLNDDQLDGLVIALTIDGKDIVVDPGAKMAPFQTLAWTHAGAGGVAIGADGKIESVVTPLPPNTDNTVVRVGKLTISPDGTVSGTLKVGFTGQDALRWRQLALRQSPTVVNEQLERTLQEQVPDGIQIHIERLAALEDPTKQLVAVVPVTGSLAAHAGSHLVLPRLFFDSKETDPFPAAEARSLPIDMHYPSQEQEQIVYALPAGYEVEGTPTDSTFKWEENAAYQLRSKVDAGTITTARILARGFTLLEAKDYGALRDFYEKVVVADHQQIALTAPKSAGQ